MTRRYKGGLTTISRGNKVRLHKTNYLKYTFIFLCLRLVTSKTDKVKISIKHGVACATERLVLPFPNNNFDFQT